MRALRKKSHNRMLDSDSSRRCFVGVVILIALSNCLVDAVSQVLSPETQEYEVIAKHVRLRGSDLETTNYYIFVGKDKFYRQNLLRVFTSLPAAERGFVTATISTDRDYLSLKANKEGNISTDSSNRNTGNPGKANFSEVESGILVAEYMRSEVREHFMYTPFQYGYERYLVTIRDKREFVISRDFLDTAIRDGYLVGVQWYLNRSSDVNYLKSDGSTPLMSAVLFQHVEIVDRLLSAGADVNTRNGRRINALMMASAGGNIELVKLLIEHGAKLNDFDEEGRTALMAAVMNCRKDVARLLIERGAKQNVKDTNGRTVHWYACKDSEMNDILMRRHDPASPR